MNRLLPLLFLAAGLAGCVDDEDPSDDRVILEPSLRESLTAPIYDIKGHYEHSFTGRSEIQLYVDYYLPDAPDHHKAATILQFTPYQNPGVALPGFEDEGDPPYRAALVDYFVPRGYAVAFADVRGNHNAGGCIDQTGPGQWQDGVDYIEWLAGQEWSNGNIGMYGVSYDGETQFSTALLNPPALKTIVPIASVSNQYEYGFMAGAPYELAPLASMAGYLALSLIPPDDPAMLAAYPEKFECQQEAMSAGLDTSGDETTFWKERDYRPGAENITASVLHVHGFEDWNVRPIHIDPLFNKITSEKRGLFGQWPHATPDRGDWQTILHAWYDHELFGIQNGILDILPPVLIEDDDQQWWGIDSFPPKGTADKPAVWRAYEFSGDGTLTDIGAATPAELILHDYPEEVPFAGDGIVPAPAAAVDIIGPAITGHPVELTWTFTAERDLYVIGVPYVTFTATSSAASTHWAVNLDVVGDDCGGVSVCQNAGYADSRHRFGIEQPQDVTPGEPYEMTIAMYPQADVILAGSEVVVTISNNDPQIQQDPTNSENHIFVGGEGGHPAAALFLPLMPADAVPLPADDLPVVFPGYTA